jgi:GAF domain-containing protein
MSWERAASVDAILALTLRKTTDHGPLIREMLRRLREHLSMRVAFVSEYRGGDHVILYVDAAPDETRVQEGRIDPSDESLCRWIATGDMPELLADARRHGMARRLDAIEGFPIGAHISVPLRSRARGVFGALCVFDTVANPDLGAAELDLVRLVAADLSRRLGGAVSG